MPFDSLDLIGPPATVEALRRPTLDDTPLERLDYLIAFLEELPEDRFDMRWTVYSRDVSDVDQPDDFDDEPRPYLEHHCHTAACISGWIGLLWGCLSHGEAGRLIGMPERAWRDAFFPEPLGQVFRRKNPGWNASPRQAAALLRHWRATGKVDWPRAMSRAS